MAFVRAKPYDEQNTGFRRDREVHFGTVSGLSCGAVRAEAVWAMQTKPAQIFSFASDGAWWAPTLVVASLRGAAAAHDQVSSGHLRAGTNSYFNSASACATPTRPPDLLTCANRSSSVPMMKVDG